MTEDRGRSRDRELSSGEAGTDRERPPSTVTCLLTALLLAFLARPLHATLSSTAITGRVSVGGVVTPGVTVTASSKALMHPRTTVTGASGSYWIDALPPGDYDITFERTGLTTLTRRAIVELARVARADAALEASEEGDSVTSTAKTISVAETTALTTHLADDALDRLPLRRDPQSAASVIPFADHAGGTVVDDAVLHSPYLFGQDVYEQLTVLRGALPVEYEGFGGTVLVARTRSGSEDLAISMRDTMTSQGWIGGPAPTSLANNGVDHLFESTAGGRIVHDRLWFFAAGWAGAMADYALRNPHGFALKLTSQLTASQSLAGSYLNANASDTVRSPIASSALALHYTAIPDAHTSVEFLGARSTETPSARSTSDDWLIAKASHLFSSRHSDHLLSAGAALTEDASDQSTSLFANDRWSIARLTLNLGARYENGDDQRFAPRIAATYDILGDGTRAAIASYSEYADARNIITTIKEATLGYASAIGASGLARVDAIRRDYDGVAVNTLQLDASYRLFDRFEAGANYGWSDFGEKFDNDYPSQIANGWISAELPLGTQTFGATLLQRHQSSADHHWPTDIGLRYAIPFSRVGLTIAADGTNVLSAARALRLWIRVRV